MSDDARVYKVCSSVIASTEVLKLATRILDETSVPPSYKILAVISNVENEVEESALVEIRDNDNLGAENPRLCGICPIYQDFDIDIRQAEHKQNDLFAPASEPRQMSFKITFSAKGQHNSIEVTTAEIAKVTDILQECRRLQEVARKHGFSAGGSSHAWLKNYPISPSRRSPATATGTILQPNRQDSISSILSYGSKAIEGLPALTSSFGTFTFLGSSNAKSPPSAMSVFSGGPNQPRTSSEEPSAPKANSEDDNLSIEVQETLHARREEYTSATELSVHVCTYNANGQFYDAELDLSPWLRADHEPDLVVIGLQEMDLRPEVVLVKHDTSVAERWIQGIQSTLNAPSHDKPCRERQSQYTLLDHKQLAGIWIAVFAKDQILKNLNMGKIQSASVMTGWAGFAGNKGACAVRLRVYDTYLCFLNAHLAAGQDMTQRRNADISDIMKRLTFTYIFESGTAFIKATDCDVLTVFGDLNYRLNHTTEGVRDLLASGKYTPLLAHDQLKLSQGQSLAFEDFEEGEIGFPCTYKYDRGSDEYDTSEKDRRPAWTDRVLWRIYEEGVTAQCVEYKDVREMKESDHKPVIARLKMVIPVVDKEKRQAMLDQVRGEDQHT